MVEHANTFNALVGLRPPSKNGELVREADESESSPLITDATRSTKPRRPRSRPATSVSNIPVTSTPSSSIDTTPYAPQAAHSAPGRHDASGGLSAGARTRSLGHLTLDSPRNPPPTPSDAATPTGEQQRLPFLQSSEQLLSRHAASVGLPQRTVSELALGLGLIPMQQAPHSARQHHSVSAFDLSPIVEGASFASAREPPGGVSAALAAAGRRDTHPLPLPVQPAGSEVPQAQSWADYLSAELCPGPRYPTAVVVWGQTERDRVYNALLAVPFQLERLVLLGMALCLDSFLSVFTLLPLRVAAAVGGVAVSALRSLSAAAGQHQKKSSGSGARRPWLRGDQLYDMLCIAMFAIVVTFLWRLKAGSIYYWVKDLTQEFLKLSVLHTALELSDKICCSFLVDVLEALAASCTALAAQQRWSLSHAAAVASDAAVALALLLAHGTALMAQALVFGVAMNSQKNTLLALLIASNFTEIKGTVLKRFDPSKLAVLASQDVVERFHLVVVLAFVLVEEISGTGALLPSARLLSLCGYVLLAEIVIDVMKHAVLGKFNEIRPGVYREFTKDLCEKVATAQSHSMHRLVGFEPFAAAAVFFRLCIAYAAVRREDRGGVGAGALSAGAVALAWALLVAFKLALGFLVKRGAVQYLRTYEAWRGAARSAAAATQQLLPPQQSLPPAAAKKDS